MIFLSFLAHYFQLNWDETLFICNKGELKVIESKDKPRHDKNFSSSRFSITVFRVGNAAGVNGPVIFLEKRKKVYPRLKVNNFVTRYVLTEGSCVVPNKAAYMDDETWEKVMKLVAPGIIKMKVINGDCVFPILLYIYLTIHICPSQII